MFDFTSTIKGFLNNVITIYHGSRDVIRLNKPFNTYITIPLYESEKEAYDYEIQKFVDTYTYEGYVITGYTFCPDIFDNDHMYFDCTLSK